MAKTKEVISLDTAVVKMPAVSKLKVKTKNYDPIDKFHSEIIKKIYGSSSLLFGNKVTDILKFGNTVGFCSSKFILYRKDYNKLVSLYKSWAKRHFKHWKQKQIEFSISMALLDKAPSIKEELQFELTEFTLGTVFVAWGTKDE